MSDLLLKLGYKLYVKTPFGPYLFKNELKKATDKYENGSHSKIKVVKCGLVNVSIIPYSLNNFGFIIWNEGNSACIVVDPGYSYPFESYILENKLVLQSILITHKHHDHCYGVKNLIEIFPDVKVYGSSADRIKYATNLIEKQFEKFIFHLGALDETITIGALLSPGHTIGHVIYSISSDADIDPVHNSGDINYALYFTGDSIFLGSIGRMFECKPEIFYNSIKQFLESILEHNCPIDNILVFPAHEYGIENLKFLCETLNMGNNRASDKLEWCEGRRAVSEATIPCTMTEELQYNPYFQIILAANTELKDNICTKFNIELNVPTLSEMLENYAFSESVKMRLRPDVDSSEFGVKLFKEVRKMRDSVNFKD